MNAFAPAPAAPRQGDLEARESSAPARTRYLPPGQLIVSAEPLEVTTILGSCVSLCLWDAGAGIGGINHYLLPMGVGDGEQLERYGEHANERLLQRLLALGARERHVRAKVFGGACVLVAFRKGSDFADRNVKVALQFLGDRGIPLVADDTRGNRGRKLRFRTDDGTALIRYV